ncbi:MAG: hypothetical protein ACRDJO_09615 [Actinomycetota bacterium]
MNAQTGGDPTSHAETEPTVEVLLSGADGLAAASQHAGRHFLDDLVVHVPGRSPLARTYRGKADLVQLGTRLLQRSAGTFRVEVTDILRDKAYAVVLTRHKA